MTQQQQPAAGDTITVYGLRALGALVAEKVMGWRLVTGWFVSGGELIPKIERLETLWSPTTDPRDWMAVVEKMRELGWRSEFYGPWERERCWRVSFRRKTGTPLSWPAVHEQPGVAVCLAAVEAVTGKRVVIQ